MFSELLTYLSILPNELTVFVLSIFPFVEMRLAFPTALFVFHYSIWKAFFLTFFGSLVLSAFLSFLFPPIFVWLKQHWPWLHQLLDHHLKSIELKHAKAYHRFGALFLFLFVVDPFPGTGIWTAIPLSILLGMKPKMTIPAILLGSIVSAFLATFVAKGALFFF